MALRRMDMFSLGVIALTSAVTMAVYDRLPEQVATHFDLAGDANGWMSRPAAASFGTMVALLLWALLRLLPRVLPATERKRLGESTAALVAALTVLFLASIHLLIVYRAIVPGASIVKAIWILVGALYVAMGLVLPRIKRNALMGIRTP